MQNVQNKAKNPVPVLEMLKTEKLWKEVAGLKKGQRVQKGPNREERRDMVPSVQREGYRQAGRKEGAQQTSENRHRRQRQMQSCQAQMPRPSPPM